MPFGRICTDFKVLNLYARWECCVYPTSISTLFAKLGIILLSESVYNRGIRQSVFNIGWERVVYKTRSCAQELGCGIICQLVFFFLPPVLSLKDPISFLEKNSPKHPQRWHSTQLRPHGVLKSYKKKLQLQFRTGTHSSHLVYSKTQLRSMCNNIKNLI